MHINKIKLCIHLILRLKHLNRWSCPLSRSKKLLQLFTAINASKFWFAAMDYRLTALQFKMTAG